MGFAPGTSLVIRHASVPGNAFSAANQPGVAYGSGATVVVGATVDVGTSGGISIVVVGASVLGDVVLAVESLFPHALTTKAQPTIVVTKSRQNLMSFSKAVVVNKIGRSRSVPQLLPNFLALRRIRHTRSPSSNVQMQYP